MTTIALGIRSAFTKVSFINFSKINWRLVYCFSIIVCLVMLGFYIYHINKLTEEIYLIKNYNKELSVLTEENKSLEIDFAKSNILGKAMSRAKELSFEKASNIKYIQIVSDGSLAAAPTP